MEGMLIVIVILCMGDLFTVDGEGGGCVRYVEDRPLMHTYGDGRDGYVE